MNRQATAGESREAKKQGDEIDEEEILELCDEDVIFINPPALPPKVARRSA